MLLAGKRLTYRVRLPGGQDRLREAILYVSARCATCRRFGKIKLNKILWKADFSAYAARGVPVTGRAYQRLTHGPAPVEMAPLFGEMIRDELVRVEETDFGADKKEQRPIANVKADLHLFSGDDIAFLDKAIEYYWEKSGREASDDSHGIAWSTRADGDPMPYELALLSDQIMPSHLAAKLLDQAREENWSSK